MTAVNEHLHHLLWGEQDRRRNRPLMLDLVAAPSAIPTDPSVVWGIDISGFYDGIVNWPIARARGCRFAVVKIADGTVKCRYVDENVAGAQAAGLLVGGYYWLYPNDKISGNAQAQAWWRIGKSLGLAFHWIDFEWTRWMGRPANPNSGDLWGAGEPFRLLAGQYPAIYSAPGYLAQYFNHDPKWVPYPFAVAQYGVLKPDPINPWGEAYTWWQQSDQWPGSELGVDPAASQAEDGDLFNGTVEQFNIRFGSAPAPEPPPPQPGGSMQYTVVWSDGVNVRPGPNTGGAVVKVLPNGTVVDVVLDQIPDSWDSGNLNKRWVQLADGSGYSASDYPDSSGLPKQRMKLVSAPPPGAQEFFATVNLTDPVSGKVYKPAAINPDGTVVLK